MLSAPSYVRCVEFRLFLGSFWSPPRFHSISPTRNEKWIIIIIVIAYIRLLAFGEVYCTASVEG